MVEGYAVPKAHRWFFYSLDFRFKLETLLVADCWYRNAHFLNKVLLNSMCLSRKKALSSPSLSCWMFNWKCLLFVIHTHLLLKMSPAGLKVIFTEPFLTQNYNAFSRVNIVTWFMYSYSCFSGKWGSFVKVFALEIGRNQCKNILPTCIFVCLSVSIYLCIYVQYLSIYWSITKIFC